MKSYEDRFILDMAEGANYHSDIFEAGNKVIDILVTGIYDFEDLWKNMTNRPLKTGLIPVVLLSKKQMGDLCDLLPISRDLLNQRFGLCWIDLIYNKSKKRFKRIVAPTLFIVNSRYEFVNRITQELITGVDDKYEVTNRGYSVDAAVDIFMMIADQWGFFKTVINYLKRRSIQQALLPKLLEKGYIKAK